MKEKTGTVPVIRTISGIAASAIALFLLAEDGLDQGVSIIAAYASGAALSLVSALLPVGRTSGLRLPPRQPKGAKLKLETFGVTLSERQLVLEFLAGTSMKEISIEHRLSYSTVRNTFSSVYEKLGFSGGTELFALGAYYEIE